MIGSTINDALDDLHRRGEATELASWEENDVPGRFLGEAVLERIDSGNLFVADITRLNFNVAFEIGYAIACGKRAYLVRNRAFKGEDKTLGGGLFDTLGYKPYATSGELGDLLIAVDSLTPLRLNLDATNRRAPIYILLPRIRTDFEIRLLSRMKKSGYRFRTFDPEEQGRLPAGEAIDQVAQSLGVVVNLLSGLRDGSDEHNLRAAFVAGLAIGMEKATLILQEGDDPVPLDYRDLAKPVRYPENLREYVADFCSEIAITIQESGSEAAVVPTSFLARLSLGASAAENEISDLSYYYIETDEYQRALRGEVRVVAGRKGSGKTALFYRVRDELLKHRKNIILDLKPEGHQLLRFRERVLDYLETGTKEHTITAFWEYILLLEIAYRILRSDKVLHMRDGDLFEPYRSLEEVFCQDEAIIGSDFAERMLRIIQRIADEYGEKYGTHELNKQLDPSNVTELLYKHNIAELRSEVAAYLTYKDNLWILMDNLDKGWPAHGVSEEDVLMLRALMDAMNQLERQLGKQGVEAHGLVFIRNDVLELMVSGTSDRGKLSQAVLDWQDEDLLREMLRRRFVHSGVADASPFEEIWPRIAITHVGGEETSQYLIDRCLMRPRALIELLGLCKSHAVNLGHERIDEDDFRDGERAFSAKIFDDISYELGDIQPDAADVLYQFIEAPANLVGSEIIRRLEETIHNPKEVFDLLLWHGVIGVHIAGDRIAYIYNVSYDLIRLKKLIDNRGGESAMFQINPAFWAALEVTGT
jgi:hypothetical protein